MMEQDKPDIAILCARLPEEPEIPGCVKLEYEKLNINPKLYHHLYFAENNRRAAWERGKAIMLTVTP